MARPITPNDLRFMDTALALAYAHLGKTAPNPSVGCIIVKNGIIIGAAATAPTGRPHAEPQALAQAGDNTKGASVYVTLEPCAHTGKTPPCADALIKAQPGEVIMACLDPFDQVDGRGAERLQKAGITVIEGVRRQEALALNEGFFTRLKTGQPMLVEDDRTGLYDGPLDLQPGQSLQDRLDQAGAQGLTRLYSAARETSR